MRDEQIERLAEESFRHSWDMSDGRLIDGAWVAGLCCECGDFVPYGQEVAHVARALAPELDGMFTEQRKRAIQDVVTELRRRHDEKSARAVENCVWWLTRDGDE